MLFVCLSWCFDLVVDWLLDCYLGFICCLVVFVFELYRWLIWFLYCFGGLSFVAFLSLHFWLLCWWFVVWFGRLVDLVLRLLVGLFYGVCFDSVVLCDFCWFGLIAVVFLWFGLLTLLWLLIDWWSVFVFGAYWCVCFDCLGLLLYRLLFVYWFCELLFGFACLWFDVVWLIVVFLCVLFVVLLLVLDLSLLYL